MCVCDSVYCHLGSDDIAHLSHCPLRTLLEGACYCLLVVYVLFSLYRPTGQLQNTVIHLNIYSVSAIGLFEMHSTLFQQLEIDEYPSQ